jgi:hypothetical protein
MAKKYLEQTDWIVNPSPDGRRNGRYAMGIWDVGFRWIYDDSLDVIEGGGIWERGKFTKLIVSRCKEVEPGVGAIIDTTEALSVLVHLLDAGKITIKDIRDTYDDLNAPYEEDTDEDEVSVLSRSLLEQYEERYRHWLTLEPPDERLRRAAAEESILDEYAQRQHNEAESTIALQVRKANWTCSSN